jgi:hypothetical protein
VLNRGRPEPDSSSSDSVTSNWSKLHFFQKNKYCQKAQRREKIWSKLKKFFVPFKKISSYGSKIFQKLIWQGPSPAEKPYSAGMSKI